MDCTRFGNKLNYYREKNDMTEKELARKLHVPVSSVIKWENSEAVPSDRVVARVSELFGVDFWNYLDMDERHGGSHAPDDEPDRSPFEVLKQSKSEKAAQAKKKTNPNQAWHGWQSKDSGQASQTVQQKKTKSYSDKTGQRKLLSIVLCIIGVMLFIGGDFILEDVFGLYGYGFVLSPIIFILFALSAVAAKKR